MGIFIIILGWIFANSLASLTMPSFSKEITSALIGPSNIVVISYITFLKSLTSLAIRDGFVVTLLIITQSFISFITSLLADYIIYIIVSIIPNLLLIYHIYS